MAITHPRVLSTGSGFCVGRAHAKNSGLVSGILRFSGMGVLWAVGGSSTFGHMSLIRLPSAEVRAINNDSTRLAVPYTYIEGMPSLGSRCWRCVLR